MGKNEDLIHTERCSPKDIELILKKIKNTRFQFRPVAPMRSLHRIFLYKNIQNKNISYLGPLLESYMIEIKKLIFDF